MTSIEEHKRKIQEHIEELSDAIDKGIENKPSTIGFHCSAGALELFELYLHCINRIPIGKIIKHEWFKRPKPNQKKEPLIERKLKLDFDKKEKIYDLLYKIEEKRNNLVYGKSKQNEIALIIKEFNELKEVISQLLKLEDIEIGK